MKKLFFILTCVLGVSLSFADVQQDVDNMTQQIITNVDKDKVNIMGVDHIDHFAVSIIKGLETIESLNSMDNASLERIVSDLNKNPMSLIETAQSSVRCDDNAVTLYVGDDYGDGNSAVLNITAEDGTLVATLGPVSGYGSLLDVCLPDGNYTASWSNSEYWSSETVIGVYVDFDYYYYTGTLVYFDEGDYNLGDSGSGTFSFGGIPGCTSSTACNYDEAATADDGSCVEPNGCGSCDGDTSCLGCTDATAENHDADATADDGSCTYNGGCSSPSQTACADGECIYTSWFCDGSSATGTASWPSDCDDDSDEDIDNCCDGTNDPPYTDAICTDSCEDETACNYGADEICSYPLSAYVDCDGNLLPDYAYDCSGAIAYASSVTTDGGQGDGYCDDGYLGIYLDLDCPEYNCDGGDCGNILLDDGTCGPPPPITDCNGTEWAASYLSYVEDGWCDDGTYGPVFTCAEYNCDGGDCSTDCAGVCDGSSTTDNCGTCDDDASNDCVDDCNGVPGGPAVEDDCGVCEGDNTSCADCAGVPNGASGLDCDGDCVQNMAGVAASWGGDGYCDYNAYTYGGVPVNLACEEFNYDSGDCSSFNDCAGIPFGSDDSCNDCCDVQNGDNSTCGGDGDLNGDDNLDILDIIGMIDHVLESALLAACDVNEADSNSDGTLNILDILEHVETILSNIVWGCTDSDAANYNPDANEDDGSCCGAFDCEGNCADGYTSWAEDTYCDDGGFGMYFNCPAWNCDAGECGQILNEEGDACVTPTCAQQGLEEDCSGTCFHISWANAYVDDGTCNDGNISSLNFNCEAWQYDGCDCGTQSTDESAPCYEAPSLCTGVTCGPGQDCDVTTGECYDLTCAEQNLEGPDCAGNCFPSYKLDYIGDGYCDGADEAYGVNFDCPEFQCDIGDCGSILNDAGDACEADESDPVTGGGCDETCDPAVNNCCTHDDCGAGAYCYAGWSNNYCWAPESDCCSYDDSIDTDCDGDADLDDCPVDCSLFANAGEGRGTKQENTVLMQVSELPKKTASVSQDKLMQIFEESTARKAANAPVEYSVPSMDLNTKKTSKAMDTSEALNKSKKEIPSVFKSASEVTLIKSENGLSYDADGVVAFEITLSHGSDFEISMTDEGFIAKAHTRGNETKLVVINHESNELFASSGDFEVMNVVAVTSGGNQLGDVAISVKPVQFGLSKAYPNPFNPSTNLTLDIAEAGNVTVQVYNIVGQLVATLANGHMDIGSYSLTWEASDLSSGMYLVRAQTSSNIQTQKVMLLK